MAGLTRLRGRSRFGEARARPSTSWLREKKERGGRDKRGMTTRKCSDSAKPLSLHFSTTDQLILTL
jgi:hypothetical protein